MQIHPSFVASTITEVSENGKPLHKKRMVSYYNIELPQNAKNISLEFHSNWECKSKAKFEFHIT